MAAVETKTNILQVFTYEPGTKTCKQKQTLEFLEEKKPEELKLEVIRRLLVQHKVLGSLDARNPFCDSFGAEMADHMNLSVYVSQVAEGDKGSDDDDDTKSDEKTDGNVAENAVEEEKIEKDGKAVDASTDMIHQTLKVYYKKRKVQTKTDNATQEFLKKQLDLKLKKAPELSHLRAQLLKSAFQGDKWTATTGSKPSVAAELSERDWSVIVRTNCLLSGQRLAIKEKGKTKNHSVERTPFNAFQLKKRFFDSYEIAAPEASNKGASTAGELGALPAHIPRFRVDDSSSMTVVETQNSLQSSMAKSSFSQSSIEASAGGGLWGVSAAAKAGFSMQEGSKDVTANDEQHQKIHVIYSFPRVTVFLDAGSLELTDEVKSDIASVKTKDDVVSFGEKYGHVFSRRVQIGGRLISSHQIDSNSKEEQSERENSLKASAAVSVSGYGVTASAEASHASGGADSNSTKKQDFSSNMSWEATGGNTTLCNNPPEWCSTVGNFRNWRIVEQGDIVPLTQLISTFKGFEGTEAQFRKAAGISDGGSCAGKRVQTRIRLINTETNKPLVAVESPNILKETLEWISTGQSSPSVGTSKKEIFRQISRGCITYADDQEKRSNWVLERWVEKGRSEKHVYGAKTFIFNEAMPEQAKFLGATDPIVDIDASGFLYPAPSTNKAWFTLESPPDLQPKIGPLETGDVVELRVRDSGDSADLGVLMKAKYRGDAETASSIERIPAFAPRKGFGQNVDRAVDRESGRFLQFRIEVQGQTVVEDLA
ncbi:uncharacterized protein FIESC28_00765 [Fusarium coffeatum]|uniref:MACPF-like domain-containing protein n=1 Tax=Fusarium coffeatum TaxID=231269 RepID=A0A366SAW2_9HYPO|nr:uncharacterized protein FIESC28_00765 [Fusarium coffeatum]RBR26471.1 hypothetical protein FIESC28_00765 [Fusarium coffeatum]